MTTVPTLPAAGVALLLLAAAIGAYQRWRAPRCPSHRPWAGRVAWLLALLCAGAGAAMLFLAAG